MIIFFFCFTVDNFATIAAALQATYSVDARFLSDYNKKRTEQRKCAFDTAVNKYYFVSI